MDLTGVVYSEAHRAIQEVVHVRMLVAQEVALAQLVVAEVRLGVAVVVEQHERRHPLGVLESEVQSWLLRYSELEP